MVPLDAQQSYNKSTLNSNFNICALTKTELIPGALNVIKYELIVVREGCGLNNLHVLRNIILLT